MKPNNRQGDDSERTDSNHHGLQGGAVRAGEFLFSFAGLPDELWDEAFMFAFSIRMNLLRKSKVLNAISEERNPYLRSLLEKCGL